MKTKERHYMEGSLLDENAVSSEMAFKTIVKPLANPHCYDSISPYHENLAVSSVSALEKGEIKGWATSDSMEKASSNEDPTTLAPSISASGVSKIVLNPEPVKSKEIRSLLEKAYSSVAPEEKKEVDGIVEGVVAGPHLLKRRMEALSQEIDKALQKEELDYEHIHAMMLRFCLIHMRHVVKDDQEYIAKIGERITAKAATIRDTYNTWPVVMLTLTSSAVSIVGGSAGVLHFLKPGGKMLEVCAQNAQQIAQMGTGISGCTSLLSSRYEGDRQVLQLFLKRDQDKEEEKKGSKHGNKESQKLFRTSLEEFWRTIRETISSILRS